MIKLIVSSLAILILPFSVFCQINGTLRIYSVGNTSIKINTSKDTLSNADKLIWLENSALAFSDNEQELYFRHPTDNYYQVWNTATKQKMAEIPFSQAANTADGRKMISLFHNIAYSSELYMNTKIWISEDLSVSFNKKNEFTISSVQNLPNRTFFISPRGYAFESNFMGYEKFVKNVPLTNINYFFNYHKHSNKLFIIITGDQITKDKSNFPYFGIYTYNFNTNSKETPTENIKAQITSGSTYKYKWYFSNNTILNFYIEHPNVMVKEFGLDTVSKKDLKYASISPPMVFSDKEPNGWYMQYMGSDTLGNLYLCNPLNSAVAINKLNKNGKNVWESVVNIRHSTSRRNTVTKLKSEILNVMAVSGSGKLFAYLNLYNIPDTGNIASIMLYNIAEKDRMYTLNDQKKYLPLIAKIYITDKESEDLALSWNNQIETSKQQRKALYQSRLDSLKIKIADAEKMLTAMYQQDIDLAKQGKYAELLMGKHWVGYKTYLSTMTYAGEDGGPSQKVTAEFKIQEELDFVKRGDNIDAKILETLTLPRGKLNNYGELVLKDKDLSDNTALQYGYSSHKYIISNCSTPLSEFKWPEFKLGNTPYIGCTDPFGSVKGAQVISESKYFKKFTDDYMNFLWKCKFKFFLMEGSLKITMLATGIDGTIINFNYETTNAQGQIISRKDYLKKQLYDIEQYIENGK